MHVRDIIKTADAGIVKLRTRAGEIIAGREFNSAPSTLLEIKGWVSMVLRERGKLVPGSRREKKNVWTTTGKEYALLRMSKMPSSPTSVCYREDLMAYIGVGTGSQIADVNVLRLATPVEYRLGEFLAPLDIPPTFPLEPTRTVVRFHRVFAEDEITTSAGSRVNISEAGLFTDGDPTTDRATGSRVITISEAENQNPMAYWTDEPIGKTSSLELEISWEVRL